MMATPTALTGELLAGASIAGKYTLLRPLGLGGMGAVWAARNDATDAEVALKFLLRAGADGAGEEARERFRREAYATARLSHRAIVRIYDLLDLSSDGARFALVMELLHGRTLAAHLYERKKLPIEEATAIALPILSALAHAHAAGIVHRDLKPENIFLAEDPDGVVTPKILDFGISKIRSPSSLITREITHEGEMLGTPSYMSPEQARGRGGVDARSDLFNVGIMLYELLSGSNPFVERGNGGLHAIVASILEHEPPPLPNVPPQVWRVIERALRKPAAERFGSAGELASALRLATGVGTTVSSPPDSSGEIRLSWAPASSPSAVGGRASSDRRWPLVAGAAGAAGGAAVIAAALAVWSTEEPEAPRAQETAMTANAPAVSVASVASVASERTSLAASMPVASGDVAEVPTVPRVRPAPALPPTAASPVHVARPPSRRDNNANSANHLKAKSRGIARDPGF